MYKGLLFVGDPHVSSRNPGGRKDDYSKAVLEKLRWSLDYAREESLLPCMLGDLFHHKWERQLKLIGDLCALFAGREILTIYGNHDITEAILTEGQALDLLVRAGLLQMVDERSFWEGEVGGRKVIVGGTSYGQMLPNGFPPGYAKNILVFWMAHTDLAVGNVSAPHEPIEIEGIDVVVNGHLHLRAEDVQVRTTRWITPGNITRESRSKRQPPAVLRIDVDAKGWRQSYVEVPHASEEEVFSPKTSFESQEDDLQNFLFVQNLKKRRELIQRGRARGEALTAFLDANKADFDKDVFERITLLAKEVLNHA